MRRKRILSILISFIIIIGGVGVVAVPRIVPFGQCSGVYQQYADVEGVDACFFRDYSLDDSTRIDVTCLKAGQSTQWESLLRDFGFTYTDGTSDGTAQRSGIQLRYAPRTDYSLPMDSSILNNDVVVASYDDRRLVVFHISTQRQVEAIVRCQLSNLKKRNSDSLTAADNINTINEKGKN